jgi:G3E family GTPase
MRTTVVCGMLGSGKTTFIRQFVGHIRGRTVVLVNDFGRAGIDGEIFSAEGVESIELPSGCVCCTLKFDLITTIRKIMETLAPQHLLIEPSGVAAPSGVLEALEELPLRQVTVVGIVDAAEFLELSDAGALGGSFEDQIENSDIILVNKIDLVDQDTAERTVLAVERMNPGAIVYRTVNCSIEGPLPEIPDAERPASVHAHRFHFESISFNLGDGMDMESVSGFFHDMSIGRYGDIVRAKALVNTLQGPFKFDLSFANVQAVPFDKPVTASRLVVIGKDLNKEALSSGSLLKR